MAEEKGIGRSKINWLGIVVVVLGMITDPMFMAYFGDLIPQAYVSKMMFVAGWAVIYFRSNGQANIDLNWKNPWKATVEK